MAFGPLAITLVLLLHIHGLLPGGWIGVDVFFVLSGYLITIILLREIHRDGRISLMDFYIRRAIRLTPPLAVLALFQVFRASFYHSPST